MLLMELCLRIWADASFPFSLYVAIFIITLKIPRRKFAAVKMLAVMAAVFAVCDYINNLMTGLEYYTVGTAAIRSLNCIFVFAALVFSVLWGWECSAWEALFCATTAYCMQHLTWKIYEIGITFSFFSTGAIRILLWLCVTAIFYGWIIYIFMYREYRLKIMTDNQAQILVSFSVLMSAIVMNTIADYYVDVFQSAGLHRITCLYSFLAASLSLFIQFSLASGKNTEQERDILEHLLHENENQYQLQKNAIDIINVKCHDLKHQLHNHMDSQEFSEIAAAVNAYDFVIHTGNSAVDTVLTMKTLQCEKFGIQFTSTGDFKKLGFLTDADIYNLFGNILDNAMEAVNAVNDPDEKIISLTVETQGKFLFVNCENYYNGVITFEDGLPQTTKADHDYHGFGTQSIRMIAEKYHGSCHCTAENHIFTINVAFPVN